MSDNANSDQGTSNDDKGKINGDDEVTLGEILRQQKEIDDEYEQEYLEVLGGSDDKHCTYSQVKKQFHSQKNFFLNFDIRNTYVCQYSVAMFLISSTIFQGYIKRQALYACLTCTPEARNDATKRAGVCLACSYSCHDGHDMVELYTKRNFRCDCGTAKILAVKCKLDAMKLDQNDKNSYNQNFSGVYCTCHRPYPGLLPMIT